MREPTTSIDAALVEAWPLAEWLEVHVVLAVSGGADSVAMLRGMMAAKQRGGGRGQLFVAHCNHGLRPAEATADEQWLAELCRRLELPLEVGHCEVASLAAEQGNGLEAAARAARYDFLRELAERLGARFVAVAHTADDQVETVLHRLMRGTGLAGLAGMPRTRPLSSTVTLVRPLLSVRRAEVLEYLAAIGQDYRTDSTNADPRFTRNRIRGTLLPSLRQDYNGEIDQALLRLATQAEESQRLITQLARQLHDRCCSTSQAQITIECSPLEGESPILIAEACRIAWGNAAWPLQAMGFHEWRQLAALVLQGVEGDSLNLPGGVRAERHGSQLKILRQS